MLGNRRKIFYPNQLTYPNLLRFSYDQNVKNILRLLLSVYRYRRKETGGNYQSDIKIKIGKFNQLVKHAKNSENSIFPIITAF